MTWLRVICLTLAWTAAAAAQTPFSSGFTGTVRDSTAAVLPGAEVTISAPTLVGGAQTATTDSRGEYRFGLLPPGVYAVSVAAPGFRSAIRADLRLASGATLTIDFSLDVEGARDEVIIRGAAPVVDVTSPAVPARLDEALLQNLPAKRSIASMINFVPGIASDVAFGGSQGSNEILLDGVRTTEPALQEPVLRANYNWVQEMNVVALGAPAEYGGFTGAAGYAVLRSGANRFSGLSELWTTQPGWLANNTQALSKELQQDFASRQIHDWYDASAQAGGPILRDRLFFFAGVQRFRHNDRPAGYDGQGTRDERDLQMIVRPTGSVSPGLRLDGFIQYGRHHVDGENLGPVFPLEATSVTWNPQVTWNAHATWIPGQRTVVEGRSGGYNTYSHADPRPPATTDGPPPRYDFGTGAFSENVEVYSRVNSTVQTTTATLLHVIDRRAGIRHEVKAGLEYESTSARQEYRYPAGRGLYYEFGEPVLMEVWAGQAYQATTARWVAHAHDTWTVSSQLTVSAGVRFEWNRGSVPTDSDVFHTNAWAPRVGVAWDLTPAHRTVARLHYGHYYDPIFASRIMSEDHTDRSPSVLYEPAGPGEWVEISRSAAEDNFTIDPNLKHSHVRQFVAGLEHELASDLSVQAQYIRRRFDTFMGLIDPASTWEPVQRRDPGPDGRLGTADDGAMLDLFNRTNSGTTSLLYTNPEGAFNKYDAVQVVARKRYSRGWQMQSSYTWSSNRGTVGNRMHVNAARFDLGNPGRFMDPNQNINAYGRAAFDPTHEVKLLGSYRVPFWGGTMVSGVYRYMTGQAWGRNAVITGFSQGVARVRIEPVGTRRAPAINEFDLRAEKLLPLSDRGGTLGLFFDLFNVFNQGVPDSNITNAISDLSNARFGLPNFWVDPRLLRVGVRVTF